MQNLSSFIMEALNDSARIFIIIKPGFFKYSQQILDRFKEDGWVVEKQTSKKLIESEARTLYKIHKDEDWFDELVEYMTSDVTTAFILKNDSMKMSPEVFEKTSTIKDEIRDKWGKNETENVMHSSDSIQHMKQESAVYFAQ